MRVTSSWSRRIPHPPPCLRCVAGGVRGGQSPGLTGQQSERAGEAVWRGEVSASGFISQQHPPDEGLTLVPGVSFTLGFSPPAAVAPGPILFLISAAMVMKACSTLVAFLALVSKKGIPRESANSWKQRRRTAQQQVRLQVPPHCEVCYLFLLLLNCCSEKQNTMKW